MLKLRLARTGRKKRPYYRLVVTEHTFPRDGRFLEILGQYDPIVEPHVFNVKAERVKHWLSQGAQPTVTVHRLLHKEGLIDEYKAKPRSKRADAKRAAAKAAEEDSGAEASAAAKAPAATTSDKASTSDKADDTGNGDDSGKDSGEDK